MPSTLIAESFPTNAFAVTRKDSGAYGAIRMDMQWNTRPLGWLPEALSKPNNTAGLYKRGHHDFKKNEYRKRTGRRRRIKPKTYILNSPQKHLDKSQKDSKHNESQHPCYINFPRLSTSRTDTAANGDLYIVSSPSQDSDKSDKMAPTVSKPSAKDGSEATNTKTCVALKKVSAYSNDFFKINKQIIDTTDEFGGIKLSDILTKEATRNISKSDTSVVGGKPAAQSDNKVLPGLHDDVSNEEESDLMLKGRQAPATVKHQERKSMDDIIESNDVTSIESKVSLEEAGLRTVSTHDVKEVWCEDTDDGKSSTSDVIEDENTRFSESPEAPDNGLERQKRPSSDYVITEKILRKLQPPVPHVIWPENKFMTQNTSFVYGSPSRLAPVIVPVHSVDCPISKMFFPSKRGNVCPPNSPTGFLTKEYGFYPVERHYGYSDS